jgi:DNA polymerase-1
LENLYKELEKDKEIKPRLAEILRENKEEAFFSRTLAEIRRDAPVKFNLEDCAWKKSFDVQKVNSLFSEFGFRSLIERIANHDFSSQGPRLPLREKFKGAVPEKLFNEVELPLSKIISEMEKTGILLDVEYLKKLSKEFHAELEKLEKKTWELAGQEFNVNSPKQIGEILFDKLGLKTKNRSTDAEELERLKDSHPIISEIISHRELAKLVSTYIDALPKLADKNGRLHTTFDQAGTTTGRISSKNPNLQNIPKRTELGRSVRRAFVADKGFNLASFDYSQIELRVLAILSRDEKLLEIFKKGEDIHNAVASEVFGVPKEKVTPEMRRRAKVINFGIIYGMGINALRQNLGTTREEAQRFYDEYFMHFRGVADYIERAKEDAREKGYTETLFGRKRFFPEIKATVEYVRKEAERMAVNAPLQGTAADLIKLAMVKIDKMLGEKFLKGKARLLLQIHDELVFEIEEGSVPAIAPEIKKIMEGVYKGDIPIEVNVVVGKNWEDMVKYD